MSKELKPQIYYYIRRGWFDQLVKFCDNTLAKKGKDIVLLYWKAYGLGCSGNLSDSIRLFESFQSRREIQFPVSLALLHFHKMSPVSDYETIGLLESELSVAEDVTVRSSI